MTSDLINEFADRNCYFLVDYQLGDSEPSGLEFIEQNNLDSKSILVTQDFESEEIQKRCESLGVRIIPKILLPFIEIRISEQKKSGDYDLVLIDNDELMRTAWHLRGNDFNKKVAVFDNLSEFLEAQTSIETPIYIDYHLNDGVNGIAVAEHLSKNGFQNLFITTGDERVNNLPPYIKSVQGKDFPAA